MIVLTRDGLKTELDLWVEGTAKQRIKDAFCICGVVLASPDSNYCQRCGRFDPAKISLIRFDP